MKNALFLAILFLLLALRFGYFFQNRHVYVDQERVKFMVRLTEEPELKNGQQQFSLKTPDGQRVKVITGSGPLYHFGDRLMIDGVFTKKNYKNFSYLVTYFPKIQNQLSDDNIISQYAIWLRLKAKSLFLDTLPPISSSLLLGILFGGKEGMPDDFYDQLQVTGVLHIIAASGMNVSFVAGAFMALLTRFVKRQIALVVSIFGILFYAIVAGFEPSIVRAAIMSVIAFSASLLGRQSVSVFALCLTGWGMLFVSPGLYADIGFQLSFLATLGILLIKPLLPLGKKNLLTEDLGTTLAAQIATLPFLLTVFGRYGLLSILVNALVLWMIPVLMLLGASGFLLSFLFVPLGQAVIFLALPFLLLFEKIIVFFGSIGWTLTIGPVPLVVSIGYYLLLLSYSYFKRPTVEHPEGEEHL